MLETTLVRARPNLPPRARCPPGEGEREIFDFSFPRSIHFA